MLSLIRTKIIIYIDIINILRCIVMKEEVFFSKGMKPIKEDYPELYDISVSLNDVCYTGKSLDYKTQKLIAIAIAASASDDRAIKKQILSGMKELDITKDEVVDVLRVVLLLSGKPAFMKGINALYDIKE
jgi:alkylhydroperoxidase/carboxymuconolactone decarboxylase family protein YurZ